MSKPTGRGYVNFLALTVLNRMITFIPFWTIRKVLFRLYGMKIGHGVHIAVGVRFLAPWRFSVGDNSQINTGCKLDARGGLSVGKNVDLGWQTSIFSAQHSTDAPEFDGVTMPVVIEDYVWLASNVIVLPGITLHEGAVAGAGAVITKDVDAYVIVAGNPARPIRNRKSPMRYQLRPYRFFDWCF